MKIDRTKIKKNTSEVPADCKALIEKLKGCPQEDLHTQLEQIKTWTYGKCELYHWADVLDIFDDALDKACCKKKDRQWILPCDLPGNENQKKLLLQVLQFTSLLIEHSFTRHFYNSMEHLTTLLSSSDMTVVLGVLNLLYVFSKRSNFITRLNAEKKQGLVIRLTHLAESWGGKENGFGLAECCQDLPSSDFPNTATTLHFEFYAEQKEDKSIRKNATHLLNSIHLENVDQIAKLPASIMEDLDNRYNIPEDKKILLFTHIRLAHSFSKYEKRIQCVQGRLQAISILVYSNAMQDNVNSLLYNGFIEELVDVLGLKNLNLLDIKAAALRTLTSIIHLERNPKLNNIIDATEASSYHGFLPVLVRDCIQHMTNPAMNPYPQPFATALFSFLYHLASYESGGEALVSCGMMESLLKVINWFGDGQEHITFVTRGVRVVDLITNLDMAAFQTHGGLSTFIQRLEHEVDLCRKEQPFVIRPLGGRSESNYDINPATPSTPLETTSGIVPMETDAAAGITGSSDVNQGASTSAEYPTEPLLGEDGKALQCFPQRAALLKSMLNFLKKAIPDPSFSESIRHLMDGSLPRSLKHIISNAEYYGPSLFLLATDVVTVYVFQEPSLLSSLQDNGLTDVVLHALLIKDVPATREVLASLPNVFSALCLNTRGLQSFVQCKPFDRLFKVLLSPDYLVAMRRRRTSDPLGDTASNLGNAMDELMRHQPSLRTDATKAIIKLLEEVCAMGRDPKYVCQKSPPKAEQPANVTMMRSNAPNEATSSDDEDDDDEVASTHSGTTSKQSAEAAVPAAEPSISASTQERIPIPLMDYVLNVMKFVEAILSNNTTDDHCQEFVTQKGLVPLMGVLGLPNLPVDFPASPSCGAVASVCKSILTLSHEPQVLKQGLLHLNEVLQSLEPLHKFVDPPGGSVLLKELANAPPVGDPTLSCQATPLLHALSAAHAYITMFTHVCKAGQNDIRSISVNHWGSDLGLQVLQGLSKLYTSLVWESTVLLAFCSEDILPPGCEFGKADLEKLLPKEPKPDKDSKTEKETETISRSSGDMGSNGVSAAMESLSTSENTNTPMDTDDSSVDLQNSEKKSKLSPALQAQIKQIKPLLSASSRLGRALAELFGLLVKLSVGSPVRQRRTQQLTTPSAPTPAARSVASALTTLLANGLSWNPPPASPVPKLRLTFFICSVGFTSPMLFDEKKNPYHLMLQKFLSSNGQKALFDSFMWALTCGYKVDASEGIENVDLPDGTGEFLDAWLMLVEKMVNTKNVLESPHTLPVKPTQPGAVPFNPLQYLIHTHKAAFNAMMYLWNKKPLKVYGGRMSESILAILCHIIKGEAVIKERLDKEKDEPKPTAASSSTASSGATTSSGPVASAGRNSITPAIDAPEAHQEHLQQLMDMGFSLQHCIRALLNTNSFEQALEYCLTHPPPMPSTSGDAAPAPATATAAAAAAAAATAAAAAAATQGSSSQAEDVELSEEDQMMRAIAMSLGEKVTAPQDQETKQKDEEKKKKEKEEEQDKQVPEDPLTKEVIDGFTETIIPGCMQLLDTLPESVYRVCDLLIVVTARNGEKWRDEVLHSVCREVADMAMALMEAGTPLTTSDKKSIQEWASQISVMNEAPKLAVRLHLLSLLFEEMKIPSAEAVEDSNILDLLVRLLETSHQCLSVGKDIATPKWMAPLLLVIDLYEKVAVSSKRKAGLNEILGKSHIWKWFDDRSGKWCNYSSSNNKTIDDAYQAGDSSIRFTAGRRRYTVQFNSMVQVNEETGNRRPIMLSLPNKEDNKTKDKGLESGDELFPFEKELKDDKMDTTEESLDDTIVARRVVNGLSPDQINSVIRSGVELLAIPVDPDSLHAVMRLFLRLTREHKYALTFAELRGPKLLLGLTQSSAFQGFTSLASLLLRHVLEEPNTLTHTLEKVVRSACAGTGSSASGVTQGSLGSKEMNYVLRVLGPAACRCPENFQEVAKRCLRIALPPPAKKDEEEARLSNPNTPQVLKCLPSKQVTVPQLESPIKDVISELLNALAIKYNWSNTLGTSEVRPAQTLAEVIQEVTRDITEQHQMLRQNSSAELQAEEGATTSTADDKATTSQDTPEATPAKPKEGEETEKRKRPLLPKSGILRLLAEIVRSYSGCALLVTQYNYHAGQTELVAEDFNVLAFIMDNLLPQCQDVGDKDCPALSRVFIASIASCNHCPEAQTTLVTEIKGALQRALFLPESSEKHSKIQALTGIISTVIESCPTPGQIPNQVFKGQQSTMNAIVKCLIKKGMVTDLARIPHSLDLSSPNMATTVNAALKPLETLSRIVNQPQTVTTKIKSKPTPEQSTAEGIVDESAANNPPDTTDQQPQASGQEERVNTERDVMIEELHGDEDTEGLEETEPAEAVEPPMDSQAEDSGLEEVLDELLQGEAGDDAEDQVLGEIIRIERAGTDQAGEQTQDDADVDIEGEVLGHNTDVVIAGPMTDEEADPDADDAEDDQDENDDEDEEAEEEAEEDESEQDDDEEDEDGSDMEGDNDDYGDVEDTLYRLNDNDLFVQLEDVLPQREFDRSHFRTYQLPVAMHDAENGNDVAGPSVPPAPSNVTSNHPLLVRLGDQHSLGASISARIHRSGRQRGTYRYNPSTQTLHVHYTATAPAANRHPNPPAILQRLLGPSAAADVLQLTNTLSLGSNSTPSSQPRFHVVTSDDVRMLARPDDDMFEDFLYQDPFNDPGTSGSGVLSSVPTPLSRWTEEARVLDGDSMHDCVTVLKPEIMEELEKYRNVELTERKEKRKKASEEELAKKDKEQKEKDNVAKGKSDVAKNSKIEQAAVSKSSADEPATSLPATTTTTAEVTTHSMEIVDNLVTRITSSGETAITSSTSTLNEEALLAGTPSTESTVDSAILDSPAGSATLAAERLATAVVEQVLSSDTLSTPPTLSSTGQSLSDSSSTTSAPLVIDTGSSSISTGQSWHQMQASLQSPMDTSDQQPPQAVSLLNVQLDQPSSATNQQNQPPTTLPPFTFPSMPPLFRMEDEPTPFELENPRLQAIVEGLSQSVGIPRGTPPSGGGIITPDEVSNITSSDAVTVHTSGSGSGSSSGGVGTPSSDQASASTSIATSEPNPGSSTAPSSSAMQSSSEPPNMFGDIVLPEGVDPSFLAALPDSIRQEVIAEQVRLQRIQQRAQEQRRQAQNLGVQEVNPEFLAALPPNIQEEVLAQQRAEQARLSTASATTTTIPPDVQADPSSFITSLPASLRQQVLADMDDSMVAVLPADLAAEAQSLRRDLEERHRRLMQERLFAQGLASRYGTSRYAIRQARSGGGPWSWRSNRAPHAPSTTNTVKLRGRHLLDHEALTCLLVLLFVDEPKLNTTRLQRVLRNLCYHAPTRNWVIRSLLSIMQRTNECRVEDDKPHGKTNVDKVKKKSSTSMNGSSNASAVASEAITPNKHSQDARSTHPSWLSISLDAALGCRANVFQIQRTGGKKHMTPASMNVNIHSQASPLICRHVLDTLISLAKSFPNQFLPANKVKEVKCEGQKNTSETKDPSSQSKTVPQQTILEKSGSVTDASAKSDNIKESKDSTSKKETDFWELLMKLDSTSGSKKGKGVQRAHSNPGLESETVNMSFEQSPIGQLMTMLAHPVIRRSQLLTDRLLRLLGLVSIVLTDVTSGTDGTSGPGISSAISRGLSSLTNTRFTTLGLPSSLHSQAVIATPLAATIQPLSAARSARDSESSISSNPSKKESSIVTDEGSEAAEEAPILEPQLQLAVEVLTSKSCSEEGLEDATHLLLQLSRANGATRDAVLKLLLEGAKQLGLIVCSHIRKLLEELKDLNIHITKEKEDDSPEDNLSLLAQQKGMLTDRFAGSSIVVAAPSKVKAGGRELLLPTMTLLTSKTASQQFLLRILKVIIQLREDAARVAAKKAKTESALTSITAMAMADNSEIIMDMGDIGRSQPASSESNATSTRTAAEIPSANTSATTNVEADPSAPAAVATSGSENASQSNSDAVIVNPSRSSNSEGGAEASPAAPMDVDPGPSGEKKEDEQFTLPRLSEQLSLDVLWDTLGECLTELAKTPDHHAVLVLQPAVEAFFLVHAGEKDGKLKDQTTHRQEDLAHINADLNAPMSPNPSSSEQSGSGNVGSLTRENSVASVSAGTGNLSPDTQKFLRFADTHRTVLNQILRQLTTPLADGPFQVLVDHTKVLDFDVKRRYFRQALERMDDGLRREDLAVHVRREHVFEDSFREIHRKSADEWKHRFYIVFEGEEGQDAGGLLREWYLIISREIFNPMYALFCTSPGDRVTYTINSSSHCNSNHLSYFKFVGRIIAKAIYDNKLLECYFTRSFYKHILGVSVKYTDMESEDYSFYQGLVFLLENDVKDLGYELTFSTEIQEFGVTECRDLKPNGRNLPVLEPNKKEYVKQVCQMKMTGAIRKQLNAFLEGFYDIIPKRLISIFNEQELELLISGLPTVDIDDLKANTEYHKYQLNSLQIQWFWRALRSFDQADRARFLQFVTGTSKVPLQGFAHLEGMNGTQKFQIHRDDRSTDRLPCAHTCFNQLDLPAYETYDKLKKMLLLAINECSEGFGLA